jgi:predicted metalloprotease with PDZ domain
MSNHGEGRSGGFAMITVPDTPLEVLSFSLAHEYFHSWNPGELGGADPDPEATGYWFSEGFTDYYGRKLALEAGVVDLTQFVAEWNMSLNRYAGSAHRLASNKELSEHPWTDAAWQKAPYDRGAILAVYLNAEWRGRGVTLDRFMRTLRDRVAADPKLGALPFRQRIAAVTTGLGVPVDEELTRYIDRGEAIVLPEDAFGGCLRVLSDQVPDFAPGYDVARTRAAGVYVGVDPDAAAYGAGIREGMTRLDSQGGDPGDGSVPIHATVRDADGHVRTVIFVPAAKTSHLRQRLVLPDQMTTDEAKACAAAITG